MRIDENDNSLYWSVNFAMLCNLAISAIITVLGVGYKTTQKNKALYGYHPNALELHNPNVVDFVRAEKKAKRDKSSEVNLEQADGEDAEARAEYEKQLPGGVGEYLTKSDESDERETNWNEDLPRLLALGYRQGDNPDDFYAEEETEENMAGDGETKEGEGDDHPGKDGMVEDNLLDNNKPRGRRKRPKKKEKSHGLDHGDEPAKKTRLVGILRKMKPRPAKKGNAVLSEWRSRGSRSGGAVPGL